MKELRYVIQKVRKMRSVGVDQIPVDVLKEVIEESTRKLLGIMNKIYKPKDTPKDFQISTLISLKKLNELYSNITNNHHQQKNRAKNCPTPNPNTAQFQSPERLKKGRRSIIHNHNNRTIDRMYHTKNSYSQYKIIESTKKMQDLYINSTNSRPLTSELE